MDEQQQQLMIVAQQQFKRQYKFRLVRHDLVSICITAGVTLTAVMITLIFILNICTVRGNGMAPSISNGSKVCINKLAYSSRTPQRGEVVLVSGHLMRVVGLPGEHVELNGGKVSIDGEYLNETYLSDDTVTIPYQNATSFDLSDTEYFLLSDNRSCFQDSRQIGPVDISLIKGKAGFLF